MIMKGCMAISRPSHFTVLMFFTIMSFTYVAFAFYSGFRFGISLDKIVGRIIA